MIEYINAQLNLWARWQSGGRVRLGYPSMSAFMRPMHGGGGAPPICDDLAMDVERAVHGLPDDLRSIVRVYYLTMRDYPAQEMARSLRISRDTLYVRLHRAHVEVMNTLNDLAPPTASGYKVVEGKWKATI